VTTVRQEAVPVSAGVADTNPDIPALWGTADPGAQLMGIRHLQWVEEQASFAAFQDERGHEQLSERTGVVLRRRYRSHDSICDDGQVRLAEGQEPRGALNDCYDIPRVNLQRRHVRVWVSFAVAVSMVGLGRHVWLAVTIPDERSVQVLWSAGFAWMGVQWVLSWLDKPRQVTERQQRQLDALKVTVNIPLYNEDPTLVDRVLYALSRQTRQADRIEVVDDGSTVDYAVVRGWWEEQFGSRLSWIRQANGGKKHAQVRTFRSESPTDIIVTIDSDTALEERALEEGLKPFADPRVQSVAGMETAANSQVNWLTRTASVRSLFFQLTACGVLSAFGEILTNRGAFALYRASLLREIADVYVGEMFLGHRIRLGDDAALTLFARGRGRTVQQSSAWSFTMYPEKLSHHFRQWIRWMRATLIRDCWRLRYLPLASYGFWFTVINTITFLAMTATPVLIAVRWPESAHFAESGYVAMAAWALVTSLRLLCVRRSDEGWATRVGSLLYYPAALLWGNLVLRPLRFYGIATWRRQGWVTRGKVEVVLTEAAA
jgi:hyaluronan synthase